jgi:hypothetical protein
MVGDLVGLKVFIPTFGNTTLNLFGLAKELAANLPGESLILQGQPVLGLLRRVHTGAHHTRLQYVALILMLLEALKQRVQHIGLASRFEIAGMQREVTGIEALQVYSLVMARGHLQGSFEVERCVYSILQQHKTVRDLLLANMTPALQQWATKVLASNAPGKTHQLLGVYLLTTPSNSRLAAVRGDATLLIEHLLSRSTAKSARLMHVFNLIKALAFVGLDTQHTNTGVTLSIPFLVNNMEDIGRRLFQSSRSHIREMLRSVTSYLSESVYGSPEAMWEAARFRASCGAQIAQQLCGKVAGTDSGLAKLVHGLRKLHPSYKSPPRPLYTVTAARQSDKGGVYDDKAKQDLAKDLRVDAAMIEAPLLHDGRQSWAIAFHPSDRPWLDTTVTIGRIARKLCEVMSEETHYARASRIPAACQALFLPTTSCVKSLLYHCFGTAHRIILEPSGLPEDLVGLAHLSKTKLRKQGRSLLGSFSNVPPDRLHEMETTMELLNGKLLPCGACIAVLQQVRAWSGDKQTISEFDGLVICVTDSELQIAAIEAKSGSMSGAMGQLNSGWARLASGSQIELHTDKPQVVKLEGGYALIATIDLTQSTPSAPPAARAQQKRGRKGGRKSVLGQPRTESP